MVRYAVPVYKYLMQMEEIGPWSFGQFAEIFQRGEDNFSSKYLIHLRKAKELLKEEKSYALLPFVKIFEANMVSLRNSFCPIRKISGKDVNEERCPYMIKF